MAKIRSYEVRIMFALPLLIAFSSQAQDNYFKIAGQYRARTEFRHGYKTLAADTSRAAFFVAQRARLSFEYKKENITAFTSIQDSRTWGDEEAQKDIPGLSVNELWLELNLKKGFSLKMGRQELVYDDQRLLGNVDWGNVTRSHDALLLKFNDKEKKFSWHSGAAFNQNGEPLFGTNYPLKNYKFLAFTWLKKEFEKSSLSAIAIANGLNTTVPSSRKTHTSYTFGPVYTYQNKVFKSILGAYYQTGKTENNLQLSAWMVNAYGELHNAKIIAGLGVDYLSGNDGETPSNRNHSFSTLYATNHKFYGYMDYFINVPADTKQSGLVDPYVRVGFIVSPKITTSFDLHHFLLANGNTFVIESKKDLGTEFDALFDYKPSPLINFQAGYAMMFATNSMETLKGGNKNSYNGWGYVMLKVSPTFFTQEFKK